MPKTVAPIFTLCFGTPSIVLCTLAARGFFVLGVQASGGPSVASGCVFRRPRKQWVEVVVLQLRCSVACFVIYFAVLQEFCSSLCQFA